jgi:hypothetical protein
MDRDLKKLFASLRDCFFHYIAKNAGSKHYE